jgi:ubiquinone/menaquinone biosynthesis C-methylase UbiE
VISPTLLSLVACPDCRGTLDDRGEVLICRSCGRRATKGPGYLDLRPSTAYTEQTKYLDESLHADARHETVSPPLLQAGVRQRMLRRFLRPAPGDVIVDLGCGSGRSVVWNHASGATIVGIDVAPYFAAEALERGDLVLGDLRRLPFADGAFAKGYALDVFEHLSREALRDVLGEIARVTRPGGRVFVYSHVRKNSPLAAGLRLTNRLARRLERMNLVDLRQERLRKSDHLNPLADIPDLERMVDDAGFRIARIRYYTPLVGGFVENILMRLAERAIGVRAARRARAAGAGGTSGPADSPGLKPRLHEDADSLGLKPRLHEDHEDDADAADGAEEARLARLSAKRRLAAGGPLLHAVQGVTTLMMSDVWLFGRVRTGPFFVLLERTTRRAGETR